MGLPVAPSTDLGRLSIPFGKYELLERINIGGMAEILKARDTGRAGEPIVAVKRILPHLVDDRQFTTMFLDESRVLAQLQHENVIHTHEVGTVEGTPYITLEYVFGQDARMLFHRARRNEQPTPIPIACYIVSQVCAGLHHAHEQRDQQGNLLGLVHRDVSLQNVLLSYDGAVKLTDFGIAMSAQNVARTEVGIVKGKFGYMSPEQIKGEPMDRRSDVFATGICLYELLTGERLFSGDSDYAAVEKVRKVDITLPSQLNRMIPSDLEDIVLRALARHPRDRFQSAHDLRRALLSFMVDRHHECSASELAAHMHESFHEELRRLPTPEAILRETGRTDENTGLSAFDDLDPVSVLSGLNPEPVAAGPFATRPGVRRERRSRPQAPSVPPVVPRRDSVPPSEVAFAPSEPLSAQAPRRDPTQEVQLDWVHSDEPARTASVVPGDQVHVTHTYAGVAAARPSGLGVAQSAAVGAPSPFTAADEEPTTVHIPESAPVPRSPDSTDRSMPVDVSGRLRSSAALVAGVVIVLLGAAAAAFYAVGDQTPGVIHLETEPEDAVVTIDGERVAAATSPFVIEGLAPGREHELQVGKEGYRAWSASLTVRPGQTLELPRVALQPDLSVEAQESGERTAGKAERARRERRAAQRRRARERAKARRAARAEAKKAAAKSTSTSSRDKAQAKPRAKPQRKQKAVTGYGTLRLNSRPWSQVKVNGRRVGTTPQTGLRLPAGRHTIDLVNPEFELRKRIQVTVRPNQTITKIVDLQ